MGAGTTAWPVEPRYMLPSERVRITRRRRIAHLGVGGIIIAAASVKIAASDPEPAQAAPPVTEAAPGHTVLKPPPRRPRHEHASRSDVRKPLPAPTHVAVTVPAGWPWPELAGCEAGGNWALVTGNGFLWGLQFVPSTWDANRGSLPTAESYLARGAAPSPAEQIQVGERIQAGAGWGAWPVCSAELGLR